MCGIAGIFGEPDPEQVRAVTLALKHRGPDSVGFHSRGDLHLGVTRLRIVDLAQGDQPIWNKSRDKAIVFNGEIYNHRALRATLEAAGHTFSTRSDTEVVLHLYEEHGERCVEHLRGMFAFAIASQDELFLARDRLGIKPLYYAFLAAENRFLFASECKALLRCRRVPAQLNLQSQADRLVVGFIPGRQTLFRGIERVLPGETVTVARGRDGALAPRRRQYYQLSWPAAAGPGFEECRTRLIERFRTAVASHLAADVEVALALSGGLDSSFLALTARALTGRGLLAFTIGCDEAQDDVVAARRLGRRLGARHDVWVASFADFLAAVPALVLAEERPSNLRAMPAFLLFRRAGEQVKVCLSGEGADELFGGYPEYRRPCSFLRSLRRRLAAAVDLGLPVSDETVELVRRFAGSGSRARCLARVFALNQIGRLVHRHLELVDHLGMAAGLEVRVPFLDHALVELVNRMPASYKVGRGQKIILKAAAREAFGGAVAGIARRRKTGFPQAGRTHVEAFASLCEKHLPAAYRRRHELGGWFPNQATLLAFDIFQHVFLERRGELDAGFQVIDFMRSRPPAGRMV